MNKKEYELRYLPTFQQDLAEAVLYLTNVLGNPNAATNLIDATESAILKRLPYAESFEPYRSLKARPFPYYPIYVKNYIIFYVVLEEDGKSIMEVRRFIYGKRNIDTTL